MSQLIKQPKVQETVEDLAVAEVTGASEGHCASNNESLSLVANRAAEVFGNRQKAMRWLGTPIPALAYATPVSMLDGTEGVDAVLAVLGRIEHGVF